MRFLTLAKHRQPTRNPRISCNFFELFSKLHQSVFIYISSLCFFFQDAFSHLVSHSAVHALLSTSCETNTRALHLRTARHVRRLGTVQREKLRWLEGRIHERAQRRRLANESYKSERAPRKGRCSFISSLFVKKKKHTTERRH